MTVPHDSARHHQKPLHSTIEHTITLTLRATDPANDTASVPSGLWGDIDIGTDTEPECACATCPYRAHFLRAMHLVRELAALVDAARSMPSPSAQRGA